MNENLKNFVVICCSYIRRSDKVMFPFFSMSVFFVSLNKLLYLRSCSLGWILCREYIALPSNMFVHLLLLFKSMSSASERC